MQIFSSKILLYLEIQQARLSEFLFATAAAFKHCKIRSGNNSDSKKNGKTHITCKPCQCVKMLGKRNKLGTGTWGIGTAMTANFDKLTWHLTRRFFTSGDNSEHHVVSAGHVEQLFFSSQRKWEENFMDLTIGCVKSWELSAHYWWSHTKHFCDALYYYNMWMFWLFQLVLQLKCLILFWLRKKFMLRRSRYWIQELWWLNCGDLDLVLLKNVCGDTKKSEFLHKNSVLI